MKRHAILGVIALVVGLSLCHVGSCAEGSAQQTEISSADAEFFEKLVRPLLVNSCSECHGARKQWAGLRIDSRTSLLTGGDSGPAIVPGDPDESLLISAVRRTSFEMPPENPLTESQVAILERWIRIGAPWPNAAPVSPAKSSLLESHWAFQPVTDPDVPSVAHAEWVRTPVDAFVLAKLRDSHLSPSPLADRRTLIRRLSFDLTGLPPSPEDVERFVNDPDPNAYEKLVDDLLESPQYGEHWARKWLDLARYSDTKGYMYGWEIRPFVHAPAYRDWVVRAFNNDLPYNQFLLLQIAADQAAPEDPTAQLAMGFLTIGRRFLGNEHDIIDDRIDVLGRTTMGLTFGCARCHDHKYDPIPTADYYSLYGVFWNSVKELTQAVDSSKSLSPQFKQQLEEKQNALRKEVDRMRGVVADRMRARITDYLIAQLELEKHPNIPFSQILSTDDIFPVYVERWEAFLRKTNSEKNPVFVPWHRFAAIESESFATEAPQVLQELQELGADEVSPLVMKSFSTPPKSMREVAERYGALFTQIDQEWQQALAAAKSSGSPRPERLADPEHNAIRDVLYAEGSPCVVPDVHLAEISTYFSTRSELPGLWKHQTALEKLILDSPDAPPFAVRLVDRKTIEEPRIFQRGNHLTKTEDVPRRLPLILERQDREPFQHGSGRLELAEAIVSPDSPLTARVWVNRIWQHHFGVGIVPTPSDFGARAAKPAHAELLDWLATQLVESGWSTKAIHRQILLSSAYRQGSRGPVDNATQELAERVDPGNSLIWKNPAHRLTFEEFRDAMLAASGDLTLQLGGRGKPLFGGNDGNRRRSLYGYIDRERLPNAYRVFDFANPDLHIPERSQTTVPQQALFGLNHPFVAVRARRLAALIEAMPDASPEERIEQLFQRVYQRAPTPRQSEAALQFVSAPESERQHPLTSRQLAWQYGYGAINEAGTAIQSFQPLPHFNGTAWQGGSKWPDSQLGWAQLTASGGHPGNDHKHAVIRRWTAKRDATVSIDSDARHEVAAGNGIRCWIISSRQGVLSQFTLHNSAQALQIESVKVQAGDTLDFVVDINGNLNSDQYLWSIGINELRAVAGTPADEKSNQSWNSVEDFIGPKTQNLKPWEQLAQVLLLSNEFLFVD